MDLKSDFLGYIKSELTQEGVAIPAAWSGKELCINFLEITQRWFNSNIAYEVEYSKELLAKLSTLNKSDQDSIKDIEKCIKSCQDIREYMSKLISETDIKKSDFCLKNWNIYHLHLEKSTVGKPFRNSNLLFFQVDKTKVYFIDVKKHPTGSGWFDKSLLEVVYNNWPDLLAEVKGISSMQCIPDEKMHDTLKFASTTVVIEGKVFCPTNVGVVVSGHSLLAVIKTDNIFEWLEMMEIALKEEKNKKIIRDKIFEITGCKCLHELDFELMIINNKFEIIEKNSKIIIDSEWEMKL